MGNMADSARAWSEDLAKSLGLNAYELRKTAGTFDVMLKSMGLSEQAAYDMSTGMSELAYDMASFYNLKPEEAFQKLQAGISGEIEPLKRLGILVNENTIQAYALRTGIIKQGETMTEQQKVQARYGAIMEQTSLAQGDLARTLDSPTNKMRVLGERINILKISFGNLLIPVLNKVMGVIEPLIKWLNSLDDRTKTIILVVAGVVAALGPLLVILGTFMMLLPGIVAAFSAVSGFLLGPWGIAIAAAIAGVVLLIKNWDKVRPAIQPVLKSYDAAKKVFEDVQAAIAPVIAKLSALWDAVKSQDYTPIFNAIKSWATSIMDVWGAVWGFLQPIISAIVTFVVEQFGWIITWFTENWPLISQTVATVINFISETISTGLAIIQAIWSAVWPVLSDVILPIWEAIKTVISTTIETIAGIIKAVMQAINGNWSGAWNTIKSIASNLISGMLSAIGSLLSGLWGIIKAPFELAWQGLMDMADTFMDVGAAIVDGIKNGISNAWGAFKTWMKNKIGNVVEWAKEILGIDSPSKAFANVGKFIPPGLAEGIDSTMKVAVSATKNMAKKVIDAGSNIALEIPSLLSPVPALAGVPAIMSPEALGGYGRPVGSAGRSSVVYNIGDVTVDAKDFGGVRSIEEFAEMLRRKKRQAGGE